MIAATDLQIHVGPGTDTAMEGAVRAGGGTIVGTPDEADAIVWMDPDPASLLPDVHDGIRWVQLPAAGVRPWIDAGLLEHDLVVTSAAGAYSPQVAERALALVLACLHRLHHYARARTWEPLDTDLLHRRTVLIVGAGGIGRALIRLLVPFDVQIIAVNRSGNRVPDAHRTVAASELPKVWSEASVIVLAAPATDETWHLVGSSELDALPAEAILVNVGRGALVDTGALTAALRRGRIAAAGLDVTESEPLPSSDPLWDEPSAIITCHTANPPDQIDAALRDHVRRNVERYVAGDPLHGVVDPDRGY